MTDDKDKKKEDPAKAAERPTGEMKAADVKGEPPPTPEAKPEPAPAKAEKAETAGEKVEKAEKPEKAEKAEPPKIEKTEPAGDKPKDADKERRASSQTMAMPAEAAVGAPPAMPKAGGVEDPTYMPDPRDVPSSGSPADPGTPPGHVPPGDSRSLRRGNEFALVYRAGSAVVSRFGTVGTRGQWRVVEYPTPSSASTGYAKECSRFVGEGFSDYRD